MKLVSLDVHFNQVNALARGKVIVERDHFDLDRPAGEVVGYVGAMIHIERIRKIELRLAAALSQRCLQDAHVWKPSRRCTQPLEIFWRRLKRIHNAGRPNTAGEELRVDPNIRTGIYSDVAGNQNLPE